MFILTIIATVVTVIAIIVALYQIRITRREGKEPGNGGGKTQPERPCVTKVIVKNWKIGIPTVLAVIFAVLSICLWIWIPCHDCCTDRSRYGFESEPIVWEQQMFSDSQGVTEVAQSADLAECGKHSLKLTTDLEGGHPNRSKGEAYVEIDVQNLEGKPITVWVYVPREAVGDPQKPNGIQVFVKDKDWRSEYGTWWNITPAKVDRWCQVTLTPTRSIDLVASITPGFDPTQIRAVGVKVAIGDGSIAKYKGPIYIDAVDWPK